MYACIPFYLLPSNVILKETRSKIYLHNNQVLLCRPKNAKSYLSTNVLQWQLARHRLPGQGGLGCGAVERGRVGGPGVSPISLAALPSPAATKAKQTHPSSQPLLITRQVVRQARQWPYVVTLGEGRLLEDVCCFTILFHRGLNTNHQHGR